MGAHYFHWILAAGQSSWVRKSPCGPGPWPRAAHHGPRSCCGRLVDGAPPQPSRRSGLGGEGRAGRATVLSLPLPRYEKLKGQNTLPAPFPFFWIGQWLLTGDSWGASEPHEKGYKSELYGLGGVGATQLLIFFFFF